MQEYNPLLVIIVQLVIMAGVYLGAGYVGGSKIIAEAVQILKRRGGGKES